MSKMTYDEIHRLWQAEVSEYDLQDLEEIRLGKMAEYLSSVRMKLTETSAKDDLQADLYTMEIRNLETMLRQILEIRLEKILRAAMSPYRPRGTMTLSEEEFYNRAARAFEGYQQYMNEVLTGLSRSTGTAPPNDTDDTSSGETVEYAVVKFIETIETQFVGVDEKAHGPFQKGDIASIPIDNAKILIRDGTVVRVAAKK